MKNLVWLWPWFLLAGLVVSWWGGGIGRSAAQAPTCTVTVAAPINQYVLPTVNSGSYGQTPANQLTLTAVGQAENGTWYAIQLPNSNPPTYAWIAVADLASTDGTCGDLPTVNPNDVGASLAVFDSTTPTPADLPECTISATEANIRQTPSTQAPIVGELKPGVARAIGRTADGSWYEVELPTGRGWIAAIVSSQSGDCAALPITSSTVGEFAACPSGFGGYTRPRVAVGDVGRVLAQSGRVRTEADTAASIAFQIQAGGTFSVIDGPQCNDSIVWWLVEQGGRTGWIAESEASGTYLIEPVAAVTTNTPAPFACDPTNPNYRPTRLRLSDDGVTVSTAIPSLILFNEPNLSAAHSIEIPAGSVITQLNEGPRCNQNAVWWNVSFGDESGWLVESSTNDLVNEYYLIPPDRAADEAPISTPAVATVESRAFPASTAVITLDNTRDLTILGSLPLTAAQQFAWSGNGQWLGVIAADGLQLYRYPSLRRMTEQDGLLATSAAPTAMAFDSEGRYVAVGYADGSVRLLDLDAETVLALPSHADRISAVAFSIDNAMLLTASGYFYDQVPDEFDFRLRVYDFTSLNVLDGSLNVMIDQPFGVDEPILGAGFTIEGEAVVLTYRSVMVVDSAGVVQAVRRAETLDGALVLAAQSRWFSRLDVVLFGSGPAVAALQASDGVVQARPVVMLDPGVVIAAAQAPPNPDAEPLVAAFVSYAPASGLADGVRFITPEDNTGIFTTYIEMEGVLGLAFAPDGATGTVLAILHADEITFWGLP